MGAMRTKLQDRITHLVDIQTFEQQQQRQQEKGQVKAEDGQEMKDENEQDDEPPVLDFKAKYLMAKNRVWKACLYNSFDEKLFKTGREALTFMNLNQELEYIGSS